jgi:hypothetical protein
MQGLRCGPPSVAFILAFKVLTHPIGPMKFMTGRYQFRDSNWFSTGEARRMAEMVGVGAVDLSSIQTRAYPLARITMHLKISNLALAALRTLSSTPTSSPSKMQNKMLYSAMQRPHTNLKIAATL